MQRVTLASDTPAIKGSVGLRALQGLQGLPDLQPRWFDSGTALLCSRCLDRLDHRDHQGQRDPQDPEEEMESLVIQERMEKLVPPGHEVSQELQELLVPKAKRASVERVSQDPEAPRVSQDLLDLALETIRHLWTWRAQDSPTWRNCGGSVVLQARQALLALLGSLGLQWRWGQTVQ